MTTPSEIVRQDILPHVNSYNVAIFAFVIYIAYYSFGRWRYQREGRTLAAKYGTKPPRHIPTAWPFGLGIDFITRMLKADKEGRILSYFCDLFTNNGFTNASTVFGKTDINTVEPENVDTVLNGNFQDYNLGSFRRETFTMFFGSGIFNQDGPEWKTSRSLLRPHFMHNRVSYFSHIQNQALGMMSRLTGPSDDSGRFDIDLEPVFFQYTLDTTTSILFGKPISDHEDQLAVSAFQEAFTSGQASVIMRLRLGPLRHLMGGKKLRDKAAVCHSFVDGIVAEGRSRENAAATERKMDADSGDNDNLLDSLLQIYPDDDVAVRSQCLNILLAGRDTTACLLTWCFRLLALHPQVLSRLYTEISMLPPAEALSRTDLHVSKIPYLTAVLKETLRIYPSVPGNLREASVDTVIPLGGGPDGKAPVLVRRGSTVGYPIYAMHRRKDIWGEDADCFVPERWLEGGELEKNERAKLTYMPFNAGPRLCLGQDMAMLEAATGVVHVLKRWDGGIQLRGDGFLGPNGETGHEKQIADIMVRPKDGCKVTLRKK